MYSAYKSLIFKKWGDACTQFQNTNKTYNAYLELSKSLGAWKITKESDQTTDKNLRR
jgi:hypothetical protein